MLTIAIPLAVFIAGLLIYALATGAKAVEIGRIMIFCGLLALLLTMPGAKGALRL
jgi:hypothetical protein